MKNKKISIILLTKNSSKYIKFVLEGVYSQLYRNFEVIVIDSGSTDNTLDIVTEYPVRLIKIKAEEFGHGRTRNLGAQLAKGSYVAFLTHDAVPKDKNWLISMLHNFEDNKVAAVFGRQIPKKDEKILDKLFFTSLYGKERVEWTSGSYSSGDNIFSDANSVIRSDLLLKNPYMNNIIVSEDYEWANKIMRQGYKIIYEPNAIVIHSHSYNIFSLFKRNFDIGVSYKYIDDFNDDMTFFNKGSKVFMAEIRNLQKYGKIHLIPLVIIRDAIRFFAILMGKNEKLFPKKVKKDYFSAQTWYWI